jgi:hypothetical protein
LSLLQKYMIAITINRSLDSHKGLAYSPRLLLLNMQVMQVMQVLSLA